MTKLDKLDEIASKYNLQTIETTASYDGYPCQLSHALIGFQTFADAEKIAEENEARLIVVRKRDGWSLWSRGDAVSEPLTVTEDDFGDNCRFIGYDEYTNEDDFFEDWVKPELEEATSIEGARVVLQDAEDLWEAIQDCEEDQAIRTEWGQYIETVDLHPTHIYNDTWHTAIALEF